MKILAIDTSSTACSLGLLINEEKVCLHEIQPMQQAQTILPMIHDFVLSKNITLNQLDALAFGCGPGSFTGVRIAASVIQGLGFALNLPIIPISSLAALAQAAYMDLHWEKLWVLVDARMQEVYCGRYEVLDGQYVSAVGADYIAKPEAILKSDDLAWYGVGDGWEVYKNQIVYQPKKLDITRLPMAKGILELAIPKFARQEWVSAADALPVYLRDNVAKKAQSVILTQAVTYPGELPSKRE